MLHFDFIILEKNNSSFIHYNAFHFSYAWIYVLGKSYIPNQEIFKHLLYNITEENIARGGT